MKKRIIFTILALIIVFGIGASANADSCEHDFLTEVKVPATCQCEGVRVSTCIKCGEHIETSIPKLKTTEEKQGHMNTTAYVTDENKELQGAISEDVQAKNTPAGKGKTFGGNTKTIGSKTKSEDAKTEKFSIEKLGIGRGKDEENNAETFQLIPSTDAFPADPSAIASRKLLGYAASGKFSGGKVQMITAKAAHGESYAAETAENSLYHAVGHVSTFSVIPDIIQAVFIDHNTC